MSEKHMHKPSETDWARIDAMTDEEIDTSDIPPLTEEFVKRARVRMPKKTVAVTLQIDADVLKWFQAQGDDYLRVMNAALRNYAETHNPSQP
ncbi:MAG: BrnA antitoxin family protein [Thermodesulfobacteriota bacterium]